MIDSASLIKRAPAPLLAFPLLQSQSSTPKGGNEVLESIEDSSQSSFARGNSSSPEEADLSSTSEYVQLQLRIFLATLLVSALAVSISAIFFDPLTTLSIFVGALFGIIYLRLLARSVGKIGKGSRSLNKIQLLVPVLLVLLVSRVSQLDLLPALLGFLLYKPSLVLQFLLES